jgi:hypothetical protein
MSVAQLKNSIKASPDAMDAVRGQISAHLKQRALGGAADEVGNFSQSAYNKALAAIGDRKLNLFFKPEEINQMKAIGRVASYEQFQPAGAAVNNSNTAGATGALVDRFLSSGLLSTVPFAKQAVGDPLENIMLGIRARRSLDVPAAISTPGQAPVNPAIPPGLLQRIGMGISPAALMMPQVGDERRR